MFLSAVSMASTAGTAMVFTIRNMVSFSDEVKVQSLSDARLQSVVASTGSSFRPDCFKEYKLNLPFAAQTVSYEVTQNLPIKVKGNSLYIKNLFETLENNQERLSETLNFGCGQTSTATLLVSGVLQNGETFKTTLELELADKEGVVMVGSMQVKIAAGEATTLDVLPTIFDAQTLNNFWNEFDPANNRPVKNY
jgi:hypothetical protein